MPVLIIILGLAFIFQKSLVATATIVFGAFFGFWLLRALIILVVVLAIGRYWRQRNKN